MTSRGSGLLVLSIALLLASTPVQAQQAERSVTIVHDLGQDGIATVGQIHQVGFLIQSTEGAPDFHNDAELTISLDDTVLYKTTAASGHDYDGLDIATVRFPHAGTYEIDVRVPGEPDLTDHLEGPVVAPDATSEPSPNLLVLPDEPVAGQLARLSVVAGGPWAEESGSDAIFEILDLDQGKQVLQLRTRSDGADHGISYAFPEAGVYEVRATVVPNQGSRAGEDAGPVTSSAQVEVTEPSPGEGPLPGIPTNQPLENRVDAGSSDDRFSLFASYDPYSSVSTFGRMHLGSVLVDEATGGPAGSATFSAELLGPSGDQVLVADQVVGPGGVLEIVTAHATPGDYELHVSAASDGWTGDVTHSYSVHPPVVPMGAGPYAVQLNGQDDLTAGEPTDLEVMIANEAGVPLDHSEILVTVRDETTGLPVLSHKLHTHDSGTFPFQLSFPEEGTYTIRVDPVDLESTAATGFYKGEPGQAPVFSVQADGAAPMDGDMAPTGSDGEPSESPGAPALVGILAVLGGALVRRHRRGTR